MTKLCIYLKRPLILSKKEVSTKKNSPHNDKILYSFKNAPLQHQKDCRYQYLYLFKTPPPNSKKAVTTTKEPIKSSIFVCFKNASPLVLQKQR